MLIEKQGKDGQEETVEISLGEHGVRIVTKPTALQAASTAASAASAAEAAASALEAAAGRLEIKLPPGVADSQVVREALRAGSRRPLSEAERQRVSPAS